MAPGVCEIAIPDASLCAQSLARIDYSDAFSIELDEPPASIDAAVDAAFAAFPRWIAGLMALRDSAVRPLGLKTSASSEREPGAAYEPREVIGIFRVFERSSDEIVFGEDDRHLDFRASFLLVRGDPCVLALLTAVRFNNRLGRLYFAPVRPMHRLIVPAMLKATRARLRDGG